MQNIADWLKQLGMYEYAERFAENGIDISVLRHLTDQDLKDVGVLLGHRRKMLAAIAELAGGYDFFSAALAAVKSLGNGLIRLEAARRPHSRADVGTVTLAADVIERA